MSATLWLVAIWDNVREVIGCLPQIAHVASGPKPESCRIRRSAVVTLRSHQPVRGKTD